MFFIFRRRKKTEAIGGDENLKEIKRSIAELRESVEEEREGFREEEGREEAEHREEEDLLRLAKLCIDSLLNCGEADASLRATLIELTKEIQMALCALNNPVLRALSNILSGNADKVPEVEKEELCKKGFVERFYTMELGAGVEAVDKGELMKKLEEHVAEKYRLTDEWRELLTNLPVKVDPGESKDAFPLIEAGAAELYLVPSMWEVPIWAKLKTERDVARIKSNLKEMKGMVERLPEELKEPFEKLVEGMISSPP
jgi:hypothetical protein